MKKLNYLLGYPNLKIYQDSEWFNFSLDSILLANFVQIKKTTKKVLDIGTGNAVIPIILSTKYSLTITGIEIQPDIYHLAEESVRYNHLEEKITLLCEDVKTYARQEESDVYDLITCNPPYFKITEKNRTNEDIHKVIARHETNLCIKDAIEISKKLLKNGGAFVCVHRPERLVEILELLRKNNLEPKKLRFVYPKQGKEANILLVEAVKNGKEGLKIDDPLYTYDAHGEYTKEMQNYFS